jgi:hypothetical protein
VIAARVRGRPVAATRHRDDLIERIVDLRQRQQQAIAALGVPQAPSIGKLREETETRRGFATLFADLGLEPPAARGDGNATGCKIDHLRLLQLFCPRWSKTQLGPVAAADAGAFEAISRDIVGAATAVAGDRTVGALTGSDRLRPITRTDSTGVVTTRWHGRPDQWMRRFHTPTITTVTAFGDGKGSWWP